MRTGDGTTAAATGGQGREVEDWVWNACSSRSRARVDDAGTVGAVKDSHSFIRHQRSWNAVRSLGAAAVIKDLFPESGKIFVRGCSSVLRDPAMRL